VLLASRDRVLLPKIGKDTSRGVPMVLLNEGGSQKSPASMEELLHVIRGTISRGIEVWQPPIVFDCSQRTVVCVGIN
jgi:hypothetical protein